MNLHTFHVVETDVYCRTGLGKTLMTITVIFALHRRNRNEVRNK
jgi:restriction endonuclease